MKVIYATFKNEKEAEKIVDALLKQRLIACANIIPNVKSRYWWKNKIEEAKEAAAIIKTTDKMLQCTIEEIKKLHSYEVPEIIAFDIAKGNAKYLKWISEEVREK